MRTLLGLMLVLVSLGDVSTDGVTDFGFGNFRSEAYGSVTHLASVCDEAVAGE